MTVLDRYNEALAIRSEEEKRLAAEAKRVGDERLHSIHLMQASMLGDMLKVLGRVQHTGARPTILADNIAALTAQSEKEKSAGDYDSAERSLIKARTIAWARETLASLEAASHE